MRVINSNTSEQRTEIPVIDLCVIDAFSKKIKFLQFTAFHRVCSVLNSFDLSRLHLMEPGEKPNNFFAFQWTI